MIQSVLSKLLSIVCVFFLCQFPAFFQQYLVCLSGHAAECSRVIRLLEHGAEKNGKTLDQLVHAFLLSHDMDNQSIGEVIHALKQRQSWLEASRIQLQESSVGKRPFIFMTTLDREIVQETLSGFTVQIAFTIETAIYAFLGLVIAMGIEKLMSSMWKKIRAYV